MRAQAADRHPTLHTAAAAPTLTSWYRASPRVRVICVRRTERAGAGRRAARSWAGRARWSGDQAREGWYIAPRQGVGGARLLEA
jgi:hypothetical protein